VSEYYSKPIKLAPLSACQRCENNDNFLHIVTRYMKDIIGAYQIAGNSKKVILKGLQPALLIFISCLRGCRTLG